MTTDGFFADGDDCDPAYRNFRDLGHFSHHRSFVESLWRTYKPYADRHFRSDARQHLQERFWEMYLGCTLMERGFAISSTGATGPEFFSMIQDQRCWFEAIAPSAGSGADSVPNARYGGLVATNVPHDEIILRLRHAIHEKHQKYKKYRVADVVGADDPYIICINSKRIRTIVSDPDIPLIVKAVLPFGDLTAVFDNSEGRIVDTYHTYRDTIAKRSGSPVSTNVFLDPEYAGISAVLYSSVDAANYPSSFGADFWLVHNPLAKNPIVRGTFNFGAEYWVNGDELNSRIWNEVT